jgi:hypothetical protein
MPKPTAVKKEEPLKEASLPVGTSLGRSHERFGWVLVAAGVAFGTFVESLLGFKTVSFLLDPMRHELWTVAHFHAAFLGLVNLAYARGADAETVGVSARVMLSRALLIGSVLLPLGFFLGGFRHSEGDPGIGILLAPPGALLVAAALVARAIYARRS